MILDSVNISKILAASKALKVRQIQNDFFRTTFLPKNEQTNSTLLLVDLFSFIFWKKVKTPKRHFEINQMSNVSHSAIWYLSNLEVRVSNIT